MGIKPRTITGFTGAKPEILASGIFVGRIRKQFGQRSSLNTRGAMMKLRPELLIALLALPCCKGVDLNGYVYADNYFELLYNGQLIANDPVSFIPHNAVFFNITEAEEPSCRTFAVLAKDFADETTGLEYNNTCVGDGGLRLVLSDGTVSGGEWKRFTFFYGPMNLESCLPGVDINDGQRNCDSENGMNLDDPCICETYANLRAGIYLASMILIGSLSLFTLMRRLAGVERQDQILGFSTHEMSTGGTLSSCGPRAWIYITGSSSDIPPARACLKALAIKLLPYQIFLP